MRVLIAEDEAKVADVIRRALQQEGYAVDVVRCGEAVLRYASAGPYDLLVLDRHPLVRSAMSLCRALRQSHRAVPTLMLTQRGAAGNDDQTAEAWADDYLAKPFAVSERLVRVNALLQREQPGALPPLMVGDLTLDPTTRCVRRGARVIGLSNKEFALLQFLMQHAGRPVSRSVIVEYVWNFDRTVTTNLVDVYISYLRNHIDRSYPQKLIHTVRGIGYYVGGQKPETGTEA